MVIVKISYLYRVTLKPKVLSRIRGVVANYLASQTRDPGIDSHQHQKIHDIYGAI